MGTRSIVSVPLEGEPGHWEARYIHWDGYPDGVGQGLLTMAQGPFGGDIAAMTKYLLDDHPGGWSSLSRGYGHSGGFEDYSADRPKHGTPEYEAHAAKMGDACYCHGDRSEGFAPDGLPEVSIDGTRRGSLLVSHAPAIDEATGQQRLDPETKEPLYESSDWGQEWHYQLTPEALLIFKWGGVGLFGFSAGGEQWPIAAIAWDTDSATVEWEKLTEKGYGIADSAAKQKQEAGS